MVLLEENVLVAITLFVLLLLALLASCPCSLTRPHSLFPSTGVVEITGSSNIAAVHNSTLINSQPDGNSCSFL